MSTPNILTRLPKGADLFESLNTLCKEQGVKRAQFSMIGALEKASLSYYLQDEKRYVSHEIDEHVEILSGLGNISLKDGEPFAHLHLVLGKSDLSCIGGHAMPGCIIFACEICIIPLEGGDLVREYDEPTGLPLWRPQA